MKLDRVTITGADFSVRPETLLQLSAEFPFVEWGILVSEKAKGPYHKRMPSKLWIEQLQGLLPRPRLSLHICGAYIPDLLMGRMTVPDWLLKGFQRVQLNFHGRPHSANVDDFCQALYKFGERQVIFQIDGAKGQALLGDAYDGTTVDCVPLFDLSHGAGVLPEAWPAPLDANVYTGYAGGLGPESLAAELTKIDAIAGDARVWVDMETKVRTPPAFDVFDVPRVRRCLEIAKPFIYQEAMP